MKTNSILCDFTQGSVPRHLVRFMLPFMATNALQVLYSLVDMVIVGKFVGSAGLSAVSQGGMLLNFATMLGLGLSNSGQIIISQLIGASRKDQLSHVIGTMFTVLTAFGLAATAILLFSRESFVDYLRVPPESREMAIEYVAICAVGLIFSCGYNVVAAILRGMGDSRHPFLFVTVSSVSNLVLDYILTGMLGYGVAGAAVATSCSQALSFLMAIVFMYRRREECCFDFRPASFRLSGEYAASIFRLGIPIALQACAINITMMVVNTFVNQVGVAASATFGVGLKIDDILNKITLGIQYAAAPIVGQNMGAGKPNRVRSTIYWTWLMSGLICAVFVLAYLSLGRQIFALFTDDTEVLTLAPVFISAIVWSFPFMAMMRGGNSLLNGTGNSLVMMCFAFIDSGLRVLLSWLFGIVFGMGFWGFTFGFGMAPIGVAIPGALYFFFGKWSERNLVDRKK